MGVVKRKFERYRNVKCYRESLTDLTFLGPKINREKFSNTNPKIQIILILNILRKCTFMRLNT